LLKIIVIFKNLKFRIYSTYIVQFLSSVLDGLFSSGIALRVIRSALTFAHFCFI